MATIYSGIFSPPRGKLSSSLWINPSNGRVYSPPPLHVDPRTELQLEYRRRMRVLGPLFRSVYKRYIKLFYPRRVANVSPYALLVGAHIRDYVDYAGVPWVKFLAYGSPSLWWWHLSSSGPYDRMYVDWSDWDFLHCPADSLVFVWVCYPDGRTVWFSSFVPYYPLKKVALPFKFIWYPSKIVCIYASVFRRDTTGLYLLIAEASAHFPIGDYLPL